MSVLVITHDDCIKHDADYTHPERPDRLKTILKYLDEAELNFVTKINAKAANKDELLLNHAKKYVDYIYESSPIENSFKQLNSDTCMNSHSLNAALLSAGAATQAVDAVMKEEHKAAFCAVRPPGHHAESDESMGFCFFNNVAIAAQYARKKYDIERIAIMDFDVHHGNGTQHSFQNDKNTLFASTHQWPLYPGTGSEDEKGVGNIFNAPLNAGSDGLIFKKACEQKILPAIDSFKPELIIISAGFDAHKNDPLGGLELIEGDYYWITKELAKLADTHSGGKIISSLEGGYDLKALASSTISHINALS